MFRFKAVAALSATVLLAACGSTDHSEDFALPTTTIDVETTSTTTEDPSPTRDEPRRPEPATTTTTTTTVSYDTGWDWDAYDLARQELGQEMADTIVETGELICDEIDLNGVDAAMDLAAMAMAGSTDEEIEFLATATYVGIQIVCPHHLDAVDEWSEY